MKFKPEKTKTFKSEVHKRVSEGKWGLNEINYLHENRLEYHLTKEDIKAFLMQAYKYALIMAMEDGVVTDLELANLQVIHNYSNSIHISTNRYDLQHIKEKLFRLIKQVEKTNIVDEQTYKQELKIEEIKEVKRMPRYPTPKLTPWSNYN